jgi:hypothetical protein
MGASDIGLGQWIKIDSDKLDHTEGKVYLVLKTSTVSPFRGSKYRFGLRLYEFDLSQIVLQINEVPEENVNTNYDEVLTDSEQIGEEPNVNA